jgi:hypothetical protein
MSLASSASIWIPRKIFASEKFRSILCLLRFGKGRWIVKALTQHNYIFLQIWDANLYHNKTCCGVELKTIKFRVLSQICGWDKRQWRCRPICGSALQHLAISGDNDLSFCLTRNHQRHSEWMPPVSHHIHHTAPGNGNLTMDILAASENIFIDRRQRMSKPHRQPNAATIIA